MNWDQVEGSWKQVMGKAQAKWGDITEQDWHSTQGRREQIVGLVQKSTATPKRRPSAKSTSGLARSDRRKARLWHSQSLANPPE